MKTVLTFDTWIDDGLEAKVVANYWPGRPGVYSGPPEKCYEDEPDNREIVSCVVKGQPITLTEDQEVELLNRLMEQAAEAYADSRTDWSAA